MRYRTLTTHISWTIAALIFAPAAALAAALQTAMVPDAADSRDGAQALRSGVIDRPGDHDWYAVPGNDFGDAFGSGVNISIVSVGPGCIASRPLYVILRNPEGRWIRTYTAVTGNSTSFVLPNLPGRYYLEIRAVDINCVGLEYQAGVAHGVAGSSAVIANAVLCRIARTERIRITTQRRALQRRRRSLKDPAARRRYARYLKQRQVALTHARAEEQRKCRNVA
jgi:hypothetical protein